MTGTSTPIERFGTLVKAQRKHRGWSQDQLAEAANVSRPTVARIEAGSAVSTATLAKVADALGIEVSVEAAKEPWATYECEDSGSSVLPIRVPDTVQV